MSGEEGGDPPGRAASGLFRRLRAVAAATLGLRECRCQCCGAAASPAPGALPLCARCLDALAPRSGGFCPVCGALHADETQAPHRCAACRADPPPWDRLAFWGRYADPLTGLIHAYKYASALHRSGLLEALAHGAYLRLEGLAPELPRPDLVVPVPLHPRRLRARGFNQSLELARGLARLAGLPLAAQALLRTRHTVPQARLERAQRLTNLRGAFRADSALTAGRRVLLVDDVSATGATLRECATALRRAGASGVDVVVLARAG